MSKKLFDRKSEMHMELKPIEYSICAYKSPCTYIYISKQAFNESLDFSNRS